MDLDLTGEQCAYLGLRRGGYGSIPLYFRLRRRLARPAALSRALRFVALRHDALRIRLIPDSGASSGYRQRFADAVPQFVAEPMDTVADEDVPNYALDFATQPIDLEAEPAISVRVAELTSGDYLILVNVHHLAADAWGAALLARDLWTAYASYLKGTEPALPPAPSFAEHARARQEIPQELSAAQRRYWHETWAEARGPDIPHRPGAAVPGERQGCSEPERVLSAADTARLAAFAQDARVTFQTVPYTAFVLALWSRYGRGDFLVSTAYLGRETDQALATVGMFERRVPVRVVLSSELRLKQAVCGVMHQWGEAIRHAGPPFTIPLLQVSLGESGDVESRPGTDVVFNAVAMPPGLPALASPVIRPVDVHSGRWAWFDEPRLRVLVRRDDGLSMHPVYSSSYFAPATVTGLIDHFARIACRCTSANAEVPVADLVTA
jgi:hypothetical protein